MPETSNEVTTWRVPLIQAMLVSALGRAQAERIIALCGSDGIMLEREARGVLANFDDAMLAAAGPFRCELCGGVFGSASLAELLTGDKRQMVCVTCQTSVLEIQNLTQRLETFAANHGSAAKCRGCGAAIVWFTNRRGVNVPFDADLVNHFVTCPKREEFKRAKVKAT